VRDLDSGAGAVVLFQILSGDPTNQFVLNTLNSHTAQLILASNLDREVVEEYTLMILAYNPTNPSQNDTALVVVTVTDINDSPPVFSAQVYSFTVAEDSASGAVVGHVNSTDADIGTNAEIEYLILSGNIADNFNISSLGELQVMSGSLDFEILNQFTLTVRAIDGGFPPLTADATVIISVLDANDNQPIFTQTNTRADLMENAPAGTTVAMLQALDGDRGPSGEVSYFIHPDNASQFSINPSTGVLTTTNNSFDFESDPTVFRVVVAAIDSGSPPLSSSTQVVITLLDKNEFSPEFTLNSFRFQVSERVSPFSVVAVLNATDSDGGSAGVVEYSLVHSMGLSPFLLDNTTGEIFTTEELDREVLDVYMVTVQAYNPMVSPPLPAFVTLIFDIEDFNDNVPIFAQTDYRVTVSTNLDIGDRIFTVSASDADIGANGNIRYSVASNSQFSISASTGDVILAAELQSTGSISIVIVASDQGVPPLSSSVTAIVNVIQPLQLQFGQQGTGFLLNQTSATSRDFGFFVNSAAGASGSVSATLGSVTVRAPYTTSLPQASQVRGVVLSEEVWFDNPEVVVVVQVADALGDVHCSPTQVAITIFPDPSLRLLANLNPQVSCNKVNSIGCMVTK